MTCEALIDVLTNTRAMLARADNDFSRSRWRNGTEAVAEIDDILRRINAAGTIKLLQLEALFSPTSSLQEVSLDSNWRDEFLHLAARFEEALRKL